MVKSIMATGINNKSLKDYSESMFLSYTGKTPASEILSAPFTELKVSKTFGCEENLLIHDDNLNAMRYLLSDSRYCGKIDLVYIDPPFGTRSTFHSRNLNHAYEDFLTGSQFVEFLRQRLILLHELLSETGSIYVHLDERMIFHAKILLDEIFGNMNFRNCIARKKSNPKNSVKNKYGNITDYILFYTKSNKWKFNPQYEAWTDDKVLKEYPCTDEKTGRRYKKVPIHAPGTRNGSTGQPWRNLVPPPGKHWQYTIEKLDEFDAKGEIYWSSNGNPRRKVFLDESAGTLTQDIWLGFKDAHNQNIEITGYPTEKNIELLKRIISASSNENDLVLDCFCGSGTTLEAASKLKRRWIGIDIGAEAIETTIKRLTVGSKKMGDFVGKREKESTQMTLFSPKTKYSASGSGFKILKQKSKKMA